MQKYQILNKMINDKLAVVIRGDTYSVAEQTTKACIEGGVKIVEITFTVYNAEQIIRSLSSEYNDILIGAGTILDSESAMIAIRSGAKFIVSPIFDADTAKLCNRYSIPYLPGCMTVSEIVQATEYGISVVKLFPSNDFNPSYIRNINGPLPNVHIMPTGGITIHNVIDWLNAGSVMIGVGGEITKSAENGDYESVKKLTKKFIGKIREWKNG